MLQEYAQPMVLPLNIQTALTRCALFMSKNLTDFDEIY